MDERGAIERLKRGDIGGLEALVRIHQARAVQAAYLILRDRSSAEDVAQNAFVRAYERIGTFDASRPFGPWFMRVVVNDAVKAAARRERSAPLGGDDGSVDGRHDLRTTCGAEAYSPLAGVACRGQQLERDLP